MYKWGVERRFSVVVQRYERRVVFRFGNLWMGIVWFLDSAIENVMEETGRYLGRHASVSTSVGE